MPDFKHLYAVLKNDNIILMNYFKCLDNILLYNSVKIKFELSLFCLSKLMFLTKN